MHHFGPHPVIAIIVLLGFAGVIIAMFVSMIKSFIKWYRSGK
jgi:hypothetical protein